MIGCAGRDRVGHAELLCRLGLGGIGDGVGRELVVCVFALIVSAVVRRFRGGHESSVSFLGQALGLREALLGLAHLSVVDLRSRLERIFVEMGGGFGDAEFCFCGALKVEVFHFGDCRADVAGQLFGLVVVCCRWRGFDGVA